jgi:dihydrofolate reductase
MIVSLIAAMSQNRIIGRDQQLPWHLPEDLKRFRAITKGHPCVMGRKTFESIKRPLPNRPNIIVTRQKGYRVEGATVVDSVEAALAPYRQSGEEVFILGGEEIFRQTIDLADKLYLTIIHKEFSGQTRFPEFDESLFEVSFREDHEGELPFSFIDYVRNPNR